MTKTQLARQLDALLASIKAEMGFMTDLGLAQLAQLAPSRVVLIRYHQGRELIPASRAARRIAYAEKLYLWTVRDVSLPTTDPVWGEEFRPKPRPLVSYRDNGPGPKGFDYEAAILDEQDERYGD